jgi:peptide/nickel transport system permease protein
MIGLIGRRLLATVPVLLVVTFVVNAMTELVPGDPAVRIAGEDASPERIEEVRVALGLDQGWLPRYFTWLGHALQGDLGRSLVNGDQITLMLSERMPVTLALTLCALVFAVLVGVPAGVAAALHQGRWIDKAVRGAATIGIAFPGYWLGLLLLLLFAIQLGLFPTIGYTPITENPGEWLRHMLLPAIALGAPAAAEVARQLRASMIDSLGRDFVRTATAKGMRHRTVTYKHALKHAANPAVTVLATQVSLLLGAAVIVEQAFTLPGVGALAVSSVIGNDVIVVQGIVVVSTIVIVVTNLFADLVHAWLTPKAHA